MESKEPTSKQGDLNISIPESKTKDRDQEREREYSQVHHNTQNNFLINLPPEVTLPPAEEFNKYSPEVRAFWLAHTSKEQDARHKWISNEQSMRNSEWKGQRNNKRIAMFLGSFVALSFVGCGTYLLVHDKPLSGTLWTLIGACWLIGTAIHGFKPPSVPKSDQN